MERPNFEILRDPVSGEKLVSQFPPRAKDCFGLTGILRGTKRDYPVLGGVVVLREDLATERVMGFARRGQTGRALFEVLSVEKRSKRTAADLLFRLRFPSLLQHDGSPYGALSGPAGVYFRYRYSVPNVPSIIGVLSCLKRTASKGGYLLDVGSGFGHFYRYFLHSYPAEKIVLLDHSLEALITASRFVNPRTLLVCCDADVALPFERKMFSDITSFNAFQYFNNKEFFVQNALDALDPVAGSLWLTNNWNPKITDQFFGPSRPPSEWRNFCHSERWRIYPEKHFVDPVLHGGLLNLAVQYAIDDDHPNWRCATLVYSNAPWETNNKFVPLNRASKWRSLTYNSVYYRSPWRNRLVKRQAQIKFWDAHEEYYGFVLPDKVNLPGKINPDTGQGLGPLAQSLVMIESLCPRPRAIVAELVSGLFTHMREWVASVVYQWRIATFVKRFLPRFLKVKATRLLDIQRTTP